MKIISKFKDYYDCGMTYGLDNKLHYVRHIEEFTPSEKIVKTIKDNKYRNLRTCYYSNVKYKNNLTKGYESTYLLFCGKFIPIIKVIYKNELIPSEYIHGYDKCFEFYKLSNYENIFVEFMRTFTNELILNEHTVEKSPILLFEKSYQVVNGNKNVSLKKLNLVKFMDPITTFQEIAMFMGNTLCDTSTPKMPVGGDKVILQSKGFDEIYGFRTRPHKNKLKKT